MIESIVKDYGIVPATMCILIAFYLRSYLSEKAKNLATREDFGKVREQTQKMTEATEEIKSKISYNAWINQQHWGVKEKIYSDILLNLTIIKITCEDVLEYYIEPDSYENLAILDNVRFKKICAKEYKAIQSLRELIGPAAIFLSKSSIDALRKIYSESLLSERTAAHPEDQSIAMLKIVTDGYNLILSEAKRDICTCEGRL